MFPKRLLRNNPLPLGLGRIQFLIKPFEIEFGPFIDEINIKEKIIRECADMATMDKIKSKYIFKE